MSIRIDPKKVFVVVPAYNEKETIKQVTMDLLTHDYSIVIVDDGSDTKLSSVLKGMPVYILRHRVNLGQGAAIQTGIEFAISKDASYIVTFDADGQHKSEDIE